MAQANGLADWRGTYPSMSLVVSLSYVYATILRELRPY